MPETPPEGGNKLRANNKVRKKLQEEVDLTVNLGS